MQTMITQKQCQPATFTLPDILLIPYILIYDYLVGRTTWIRML